MTKNDQTLPAAAPDRKSVRKFFSFVVNKDELKKAELGFGAVMIWALVGTLAGFALSQGTGGGVAGAVLGAGAAILVDRMRASSDLAERQRKLESNHREFAKLAQETRRVQSSDLMKAILRVFKRTQIDAASLRRLDNEYVFDGEEQLLDEKSRDRQLGELSDRSIRLVSRGNFVNERLRMVRFDHSPVTEVFYNPTRLVLLFLTESQLVICDVEFDSLDGDLKEEIQRVSLSKIVNIHFIAHRTRFSLSRDQILRMAEDLKFDSEDIAKIKADPGGRNEDWTHEEIVSTLKVSRTDGGFLTLPIRSEIYFGRHRSALDEDSALTEHEIKADMMINELNRLVNPS